MTNSTPQRAVIVIPARYASTRVPGKPLAEIMGKPTVQHVYERALEAPHVHAVLVATDDHGVAEAVNVVGGQCVMTSPDHPSASDRLAEVMAHVNSTFTSICKVTNPNTVKVVLATNGDALHVGRAPIPYTHYGGNGRRCRALSQACGSEVERNGAESNPYMACKPD